VTGQYQTQPPGCRPWTRPRTLSSVAVLALPARRRL